MILKIKDPSIAKWYYYDNIAQISFNYNEYMITKNNSIFCKDVVSGNDNEPVPGLTVDANYARWSNSEEEDGQCNVIIAIFRPERTSNGDEMCIAFNETVYLLNDEGKTIERIS